MSEHETSSGSESAADEKSADTKNQQKPKHLKKWRIKPLYIVLACVVAAAAGGAAVYALRAKNASAVPSSAPSSEPPAIASSSSVPSSSSAPSSVPSSSSKPVSSSSVLAAPVIVNPLTGLPTAADLSKQRPYAVMINNISVATPQYGITFADIIYEVLAEGGITRLEAVFQDISQVETVGSVRSSRPYFLDLAQGLDAVYIHAGGSPDAYEELDKRGIDHIDGVNGHAEVFFRDAWRRQHMGFEHSMMLDATLLPDYMEKYGVRTEHEAGYVYNMKFADNAAPAGGAASVVKAMYSSGSSGKTTTFEYDAASGLYLVSEYGKPMSDVINDSQLAVKNVLVLKAEMGRIASDEKGRMSCVLTGLGDGYFACGGTYTPIKWSKKDYTSRFIYTLPGGAELPLGRGASYVCIVPETGDADFS